MKKETIECADVSYRTINFWFIECVRKRPFWFIESLAVHKNGTHSEKSISENVLERFFNEILCCQNDQTGFIIAGRSNRVIEKRDEDVLNTRNRVSLAVGEIWINSYVTLN